MMRGSDYKVGMLGIGLLLFGIIMALVGSALSIAFGIVGLGILAGICIEKKE